MTKYMGTAGTGVPPETRATFDTLEELADYVRNPAPMVGPVDAFRAIDDDHPEYAPVYVEQELSKPDKDGNRHMQDVVKGGEYVGGRDLNKRETDKLNKLVGE